MHLTSIHVSGGDLITACQVHRLARIEPATSMLAPRSSVYEGNIMSRLKLAVASIFLATFAASVVIAQDQKEQRRERLRNAAEAGAGVVAGLVEEAREGAAATTLAGNVIILQGKPARQRRKLTTAAWSSCA